MQCEMAAAGSELNGLALLTGYAAVDGIQVGGWGGLWWVGWTENVAKSDPLQLKQPMSAACPNYYARQRA